MSDLASPFCFVLSLPEGYAAITSGPCYPVESGVYLAPFGCHIQNTTSLQQNVGHVWRPEPLRQALANLDKIPPEAGEGETR